MGRSIGRLVNKKSHNIDIENKQKIMVNDEKFVLKIGKKLISAKIHNSLVFLKRHKIDCEELLDIEKKVSNCNNIDTLRGLEGLASRIYFAHFKKLVSPFEFKERVYYPPDNQVNVMLSLGYTLIHYRIVNSLEEKGFNPRIGFFHKGRGRHYALASDLMEPFRHIAERITVSLIRRKEVNASMFHTLERNGKKICVMNWDGFRKYINRFEQVMNSSGSFIGLEKESCNFAIEKQINYLKSSLFFNSEFRVLRIH